MSDAKVKSRLEKMPLRDRILSAIMDLPKATRGATRGYVAIAAIAEWLGARPNTKPLMRKHLQELVDNGIVERKSNSYRTEKSWRAKLIRQRANVLAGVTKTLGDKPKKEKKTAKAKTAAKAKTGGKSKTKKRAAIPLTKDLDLLQIHMHYLADRACSDLDDLGLLKSPREVTMEEDASALQRIAENTRELHRCAKALPKAWDRAYRACRAHMKERDAQEEKKDSNG